MSVVLLLIALYLALGLLSGLLAGLLGIGGGLVMVPALAVLLPRQGVPAAVLMQVAVATSLACIAATGISSALAHARRGGVDRRALLQLVPGLGLGAGGGAWIGHAMSSDLLKRVFAVSLMLLALQMLRGARKAATGQLPPAPVTGAVGVGIGISSALLGVGGGSLMVPYLARFGLEMRRAVGTSAAAGVPIAWAAALNYMWAGRAVAGLPEWCLGYVFLPAAGLIALASVSTAPLGARLAHALPTATLKRVFAALLMVVGLSMLVH